MYTTFFGLKENPFNLTPDPRYLYLSRYHREALDHLLYGINERKGFIAITGGVGTKGKTTLCRSPVKPFGQTTRSALIFSSSFQIWNFCGPSIRSSASERVPARRQRKSVSTSSTVFFSKRSEKGAMPCS